MENFLVVRFYDLNSDKYIDVFRSIDKGLLDELDMPITPALEECRMAGWLPCDFYGADWSNPVFVEEGLLHA